MLQSGVGLGIFNVITCEKTLDASTDLCNTLDTPAKQCWRFSVRLDSCCIRCFGIITMGCPSAVSTALLAHRAKLRFIAHHSEWLRRVFPRDRNQTTLLIVKSFPTPLPPKKIMSGRLQTPPENTLLSKITITSIYVNLMDVIAKGCATNGVSTCTIIHGALMKQP